MMDVQATGVFQNRATDAGVRILKGAVAAKASDVHLKAGSPPIVRIDGEICPLDHPKLSAPFVDSFIALLAATAGVDPEKLGRPQFDFSVVVPDTARFRAHVYRQSGSLAVALRRLPHPIPDFATLRLPPVIKRITTAQRGLVIVTGATGQGKSTTIAAMLEYMNQTLPRHVVTLEDPIEYVFEPQQASFSQREVGSDVDSFAQGLDGVLREDPDVVFVGEVRTLAEFDVALNAAESGRLVLTTAHSADAVKALARAIALYPQDARDATRNRLADTLAAVIAQKLLPRRGSRDRILVTEVLTMSPTVQDCIRDSARLRAVTAALDAATHEYGSHSFDQQLLMLVRDGIITLDTAKAAATSASDLVRSLKVTR